MRKYILIGALPPPFNGQTIAFKILCDSIKRTNKKNKVISISGLFKFEENKFSFLFRGVDYLIVFIKVFSHSIFSKNIIYIQISQSLNGFLRDRIINRIGRLFGNKVIAHIHGGNYNGFYESQNEESKMMIKKELLNYDKIIVLSDELKKMYDFQPLISHRLITITNGIGVLNATKDHKKIIAPEPLQIVYLSNMIESKGYLHVLESLKILNERGINFMAKFCGKFSAKSDLSQFKSINVAKHNFFNNINEYNLQEKVDFKGVVTGDNKAEVLKKAHFFILPTQYINEGQPISIIEAMREGCCVIASDYRGISQMIQHKKNGFLLQSISPDEIANAIVEIINTPGLFESISKNAVVTYNANFTEENHVKKIQQLLEINSRV